MAKRKKKRDLDDWDDEPDVQDLQPETEVEKISLRDFVVPEKVQAFVRAYKPCKEFEPGYESFTDAELREFFKAYVCGLGDPLALYINDLKAEGFCMEVSVLTGEPTIFAVRK